MCVCVCCARARVCVIDGVGVRRRQKIPSSLEITTKMADVKELAASAEAWQRHKRLMAHLARSQQRRGLQPQQSTAIKSDEEVLRETFRFVREDANDGDDDSGGDAEQRLARRYYAKLYREYALADLSRVGKGGRRGAVGLRWRTESEVVAGKGQFICGALHCDATEGLSSLEVDFRYVEAGENKRALVKLRLCPACAALLGPQSKRPRTQTPGGGSSGAGTDDTPLHGLFP